MSILIKGMDMPKHCLDCPLKYIEDNCKAQELEEWGSWEDLRTDCPLIEVPTPHGDLIDREELFRLTSKRLFPNIHIEQVKYIAYNMLPTVIESEE